MKDQKEIVTWKRRFALGLIQILIVIVAAGLLYKTVSISQRVASAPTRQNPYYSIGFERGVDDAKGKTPRGMSAPDDLVDRNEYIKGYRQGWDSVSKM